MAASEATDQPRGCRMGLWRGTTSRSQLNRLLDPNSESATLDALSRAADAVGRLVRVELVRGRMTDGLQDIPEPPAPSSTLAPDQAVAGPRIPAHQQILLYKSAEWERFIHEWAHFCLKPDYVLVQRLFSG